MSIKDIPEPGISVVIPVYNSHDTLDELAARLMQALPGLTSSHEVILVNDGSRDNSWQVIESLSEEYLWVRGINLMRNYGQHNALLCGIRSARYAITVTMDDDLQHPPEEIGKLLGPLREGIDVVYGTPMKPQHALWRKFSSYLIRLALRGAMGIKNARNVSAFRTFRTSVRDAFANYHSPFVSIDVLLAWGTTSFSSVPVNHDPRSGGRSNYNFRKLLRQAINMTTGFTVLPLQLASLLGFGFAVFGFLVLIYVIGRFIIEGGSVPGFPFLASIVAIFSGVQLFSLGIIGEYLARMHFNLMEKPAYVVRVQSSEPESQDEISD
jgi:undecaprenyl-phosphate 4-deoxy-4-formamido-L-arabinose transferase